MVRRVHDATIHKGGLITHTPHRNFEEEMALHAMTGAPLDEFARTGRAPVGRNAPRTAKPTKKTKKKAKKKRSRQPSSEETQRATKKQRRSKRDGRSTRRSKRGRFKRKSMAYYSIADCSHRHNA